MSHQTRVTRRYAFSAAHVLARPDWDDERNRSVYGKCANPGGHGHNYVLEVTVCGDVDLESGRVVPLEHLDAGPGVAALVRVRQRHGRRAEGQPQRCGPDEGREGRAQIHRLTRRTTPL